MKVLFISLLFLIFCCSAEIDESSRPVSLNKKESNQNLDGLIIIPEQNSMRLLIVAPDNDWKNPNSILWEWDVKKGKGIPKNLKRKYRRSFTNLSDVKRIIYDNRTHIIFCGSHGDGAAMLDFESNKLIWWSDVGGSPHSLASFPDGNMAIADAKGYLKIYSTLQFDNKSSQQIRHAGCHGVVWDSLQECLWVWGGSLMQCFSYNNNRQNPKVTLIERHRLPASWGAGGGHDLAPYVGTTYLIFSWRLGIGLFDTNEKLFIKMAHNTGNPKGLSYDPNKGEVIYTRPDSKDSRTYRVRSLIGPDRANKDWKFYKARWFVHNSFSY